MDNDSKSPSDVNAQGGEQDTNRNQPQGSYQGQDSSAQKQASEVSQGQQEGSSVQKQPPTASAQGGEQDTNREQPQGSYQQGQEEK